MRCPLLYAREIRILRLLSHANIIKLRCVIPPDGNHFDHIYILYEHMETNLENIIQSTQNLTEVHMKLFMGQLLSGLAYIHGALVIHRDLKPKSILVNSNCVLKVDLVAVIICPHRDMF